MLILNNFEISVNRIERRIFFFLFFLDEVFKEYFQIAKKKILPKKKDQ